MTPGLISVWCNTLFSIGIQTTADPYIALVWIVIKQSSVCTSVRDLHSTHTASTCICSPLLCEWKRSQGAPVAASLSGCFMDVLKCLVVSDYHESEWRLYFSWCHLRLKKIYVLSCTTCCLYQAPTSHTPSSETCILIHHSTANEHCSRRGERIKVHVCYLSFGAL